MKNKDATRLILLAIALLNQSLIVAGANPLPFSEETIFEAGSILFSVGTTLWAAWKNNSFTEEAKTADDFLAELKAQNHKEGGE